MNKKTYKKLASKIRFNLNRNGGNPDIPYSIAYAQQTTQNRTAMFNLIYDGHDDPLAKKYRGHVVRLAKMKRKDEVEPKRRRTMEERRGLQYLEDMRNTHYTALIKDRRRFTNRLSNLLY